MRQRAILPREYCKNRNKKQNCKKQGVAGLFAIGMGWGGVGGV